jgi:hypothetical protein
MGLSDKQETKIEKNIETYLDEIYFQVKKDKKVCLKDISIKYKVDFAQAEEWAKLLDEKGLAKLHYPTIGDACLQIDEQAKSKKPKFNKKTKLLLFTAFSIIVVFAIMFFVIRYLQ